MRTTPVCVLRNRHVKNKIRYPIRQLIKQYISTIQEASSGQGKDPNPGVYVLLTK